VTGVSVRQLGDAAVLALAAVVLSGGALLAWNVDDSATRIAIAGLAATNAVALTGSFTALESQRRQHRLALDQRAQELQEAERLWVRQHRAAARTPIVDSLWEFLRHSQKASRDAALQVAALHPGRTTESGVAEAARHALPAVAAIANDPHRATLLSAVTSRAQITEQTVLDKLANHERIYLRLEAAAKSLEGALHPPIADWELVGELIPSLNAELEALTSAQFELAQAVEEFSLGAT
jgi:hypothetical protein